MPLEKKKRYQGKKKCFVLARCNGKQTETQKIRKGRYFFKRIYLVSNLTGHIKLLPNLNLERLGSEILRGVFHILSCYWTMDHQTAEPSEPVEPAQPAEPPELVVFHFVCLFFLIFFCVKEEPWDTYKVCFRVSRKVI